MKILAFVDLHGNMPALERIERKAANADIVVVPGDLSTFERGLERIIQRLDRLKKTVLVLPGNHESEHILRMICRLHKNTKYLEGGYHYENGCLFIGNSGNGFAFRDKRFEETAKKIEGKIQSKLKENPKVILLTHAPPYRTKLDLIGRKHCGNLSIRQYIERTKPDIVICGHFHENEGKEDNIGKTLVVNPGHKGRMLEILTKI